MKLFNLIDNMFRRPSSATAGKKGGDGTSATVQVGTTITLTPGSAATVQNVGTESNAVLNFGIPSGQSTPMTLNRTIGGNDNATGTVTDTGSNLSVPIPVTAAAVGATNTQLGAGTFSLRTAIQRILNNLAWIFGTSGLGAKQNTLISGTTIKTVGGQTLLGSGDIPVGGASTAITVNLSATWNGNAAPYTQTVTAAGITSTNNVLIALASSCTAVQAEAARNALIRVTAQGTNTFSVAADGVKPTVAIPITVMIGI